MFRQETFDNGLQITFEDAGNRYFGDYHRISIEVRISVDLRRIGSRIDRDESSFWAEATRIFGERLVVSRRLERMGVASADVAKVRERMVTDFLAGAGGYMSRPGYPRALVEAEIKRRRTARFRPAGHAF